MKILHILFQGIYFVLLLLVFKILEQLFLGEKIETSLIGLASQFNLVLCNASEYLCDPQHFSLFKNGHDFNFIFVILNVFFKNSIFNDEHAFYFLVKCEDFIVSFKEMFLKIESQSSQVVNVNLLKRLVFHKSLRKFNRPVVLTLLQDIFVVSSCEDHKFRIFRALNRSFSLSFFLNQG